jgi:hypothetical protein
MRYYEGVTRTGHQQETTMTKTARIKWMRKFAGMMVSKCGRFEIWYSGEETWNARETDTATGREVAVKFRCGYQAAAKRWCESRTNGGS